jgi:hypothetical protein
MVYCCWLLDLTTIPASQSQHEEEEWTSTRAGAGAHHCYQLYQSFLLLSVLVGCAG